MKLTQDVTLYALTEQYPFLIEALADRNRHFKKLKNPLLRHSLGRMATVAKAASIGDENVLDLMLFIAGKIMAETGRAVEISPPASSAPAVAPGGPSPETRLERLKEIILALHDGGDFEELREKFRVAVGDIRPEEIANLEQTLVNEGLPETEIKKLCHLHAAMFQEALENQEVQAMPPGHPVDTYRRENIEAEKLIAEIRAEASAVEKNNEADRAAEAARLSSLVRRLAEINTHYARKENQLFPLMERHDLSAPGKVMWAVHDDIRLKFRETIEFFNAGKLGAGLASLDDLLEEVEEMIRKEENILLPLTLEVFTEKDWSDCRLGDDEIGYCFGVVPGDEWTASTGPEAAGEGDKSLIALSTGQLPPEVIDAILRNLPVDISFVGPDDRVAYYSDSAHRIFPRSAAVIGREVKNCHPSKSVHIVTEILEAFKKGERDNAEFWLELGGKFIHIQYLALKDKNGAYLGCLEVSQDATRLRSLSGQRRLLQWQ